MESNSPQQGGPQYGPNPSVFNNPGGQQALPNATATLVLGIVSIVGCFCAGIVGLVCGIIAIVLSNKDRARYNANPSAWTVSSFNNSKAGRICAIIGIILSSLYLVYYIFLIATVGTAVMSNPAIWQEMMNNR